MLQPSGTRREDVFWQALSVVVPQCPQPGVVVPVTARPLYKGGIVDTITITARFRNGALLTFLATTTAYGDLPLRVAIMGDGGAAVTLSEKITHFVTRDGREASQFDGVDQQLAQLTDFVTAVEQGTTPLVTSTQARAAVAFIEAAYTSARTGQPVRPR